MTTTEIRARFALSDWLNRPIGHTILAPIATIAGAGTTIAAPILLRPDEFVRFVLFMSVFQYISDFDLGIARMIDRSFAGRPYDTPERLRPFLVARLWIAMTMAGIVVLIGLVASPLAGIAGIGGIAFMLGNGPVVIYRASSNLFAFTLTSLAMQAGLSLPRLSGIYFGGVEGCIAAMAGWYVLIAIVNNLPFVSTMQRPWPPGRELRELLRSSLPLCVFNILWLVFLLSSRWFAWFLNDAVDAGLFAFGANLLTVGVGIISMVAAAYYPRHLALGNKILLARELTRLIAVVTVGVIVGQILCRFGLKLIFPHFQAAASSTAIILISGIPMCICTWLFPLVIARSKRPWREGIVMFGSSLLLLYLGMRLGRDDGIVGEAMGCIPAMMALLAMHLHLITRSALLSEKTAAGIWLKVILAAVSCTGVWYVAFEVY